MYAEVLAELGKLGAEWVQFDEPVLVEDRTPAELEALERAYTKLAAVEGAPKIVIATYFDHVGEAYPVLTRPAGRGRGARLRLRARTTASWSRKHGWPEDKTLFAGVVNGRNVWINDLAASLDLIDELREHAGDDVVVSTSCSLQHSPVDKTQRAAPRRRGAELDVVRRAEARRGGCADARDSTRAADAISEELDANAKALEDRRNSPRTRNPQVRERAGRR